MPERARPMDRPPAYDIACGDIRKNARERIRVSLHEYNGTDCLSVRFGWLVDSWMPRPVTAGDPAVPAHRGGIP